MIPTLADLSLHVLQTSVTQVSLKKSETLMLFAALCAIEVGPVVLNQWELPSRRT